MNIIYFIACCFICCFLMNQLFAQPGLNYSVQSNGQSFYRDTLNQRIFYYLPGDLEIGLNPEGEPDMHFISMRYTGTGVLEDNPDLTRYRNILTIKTNMQFVPSEVLKKAKTDLSNRYHVAAVLKPFPITKLEARIVFTPLSNDTVIVRKGDLAMENSNGFSSGGSYWHERYFTVFLDNYSANLLEEAFIKKQGAVSFAYSFHANGIFGTELKESAIKTNAWTINPDLDRFPDIIKRIDINETIPPGYAILNIRNYDFANNLRNDLYEKTVQLEATGVAGEPVKLSVTFQAANTDVTSVNYRFRYAVKLDKPYRYRVIELLKSGEENISEWHTAGIWSALLDVTTKKLP